jgi:hypothetical protein
MIFLIHYDRRKGLIKSLKTFRDVERRQAEAARLAIELENDDNGSEWEIVVLEARSEDELRKTHRRYFATASELAKSAADDAATVSPKS